MQAGECRSPSLSKHGTFVMMLRAQDVAAGKGWVPIKERRCVVFLHGFLQSHRCWLLTAHRVRACYGHDCLLLDWPAHGLSGVPPDGTTLTTSMLVDCLHDVLERSQRATQPRSITLAGCSIGGAVAMLYTSMYPDSVDRLVLVAPAGFDEPWFRLSRLGPMVSKLSNCVVVPSRTRALLSLIHNTPRYDNIPNWFDTYVARTKPTLLVYASLDELHRSDLWTACRHRDATFRSWSVPVIHSVLCVFISQLRLDLDANAWHENTNAGHEERSANKAGGSHPESTGEVGPRRLLARL